MQFSVIKLRSIMQVNIYVDLCGFATEEKGIQKFIPSRPRWHHAAAALVLLSLLLLLFLIVELVMPVNFFVAF